MRDEYGHETRPSWDRGDWMLSPHERDNRYGELQPREEAMPIAKSVQKTVWKTSSGKRLFEVEDGRFWLYSDFLSVSDMRELRDAIDDSLEAIRVQETEAACPTN